MTPWLQDADVTLYHGDVLQVLREFPAESVDCCVTSPPYWGLRDYGQEGQLGLEPTPEEYVARMVEVFREVRRVLAPHGTVWLNLGDSYYTNGTGERSLSGTKQVGETNAGGYTGYRTRDVMGGLKPKDLVGIPWRVAFALQADGWYLRSDIIWAKPNPMPESVTDRPTKAHEYVFLLSKQPRYFFDQEAVREQFEARPQQRLTANIDMPLGPARVAAGVQQGNPQGGTHRSRFYIDGQERIDYLMECLYCGCAQISAGPCYACGREVVPIGPEPERGPDGRRKTTVQGADGSIQHRDGERWPNGGRNIRSVWEIATQPYPEAHFATFPEELARRCIAAGCPEQVCWVCGKARERVVDKELQNDDEARQAGIALAAERGLSRHRAAGSFDPPLVTTLGFTDCGHADYRPGVTLDPFMGSGTVAHVARKLGRHAVGIDLNVEYLELAARRLQQQSLFADAL